MTKKKTIRAEDITEKDILSLYENVLPLVYYNPKQLDIILEFKKALLSFIQFDLFHYLMDDPKSSSLVAEQFVSSYQNWGPFENKEQVTDVSVKQVKDSLSFETFINQVEHGYQTMLHNAKVQYADKPQSHYYRIISQEYPKLAVGFLRFSKKGDNKEFTEEEKLILERLSPCIFLIFRIILNQLFQSQSIQYFAANIDICSQISQTYSLSSAEAKLVPEILFGRTNEEISEKNFVSLPTVKKHLGNIFRKTETKSRVDFIGKFFTSPDRIDF